MTCAKAKDVLLLYRPGTPDAADPLIAQAIELAGRDPELGRWFSQHRAFQEAMRARFRQIKVPDHLKTSLLMRELIVGGVDSSRLSTINSPNYRLSKRAGRFKTSA